MDRQSAIDRYRDGLQPLVDQVSVLVDTIDCFNATIEDIAFALTGKSTGQLCSEHLQAKDAWKAKREQAASASTAGRPAGRGRKPWDWIVDALYGLKPTW